MKQPDYVRKHYGPMQRRGLSQAVAARIQHEFPRIGGPRMVELCATLVLEVVNEHLRPLESVRHGQVVWLGVAIDDPPSRRKSTANTRFVPVILDLHTPADIDQILGRRDRSTQLRARAIRLCEQAYEQGALLSNIDLAILLGTSDSQIAVLLAAHEREAETVVPRRATLHDVGTGLTHKRIICWKHYAEGKTADQVAHETHHSLMAVDRYLGQYDRVRFCHEQGMQPHQIAHTLACTERLVDQYLEIHRMLTENVTDDD